MMKKEIKDLYKKDPSLARKVAKVLGYTLKVKGSITWPSLPTKIGKLDAAQTKWIAENIPEWTADIMQRGGNFEKAMKSIFKKSAEFPAPVTNITLKDLGKWEDFLDWFLLLGLHEDWVIDQFFGYI